MCETVLKYSDFSFCFCEVWGSAIAKHLSAVPKVTEKTLSGSAFVRKKPWDAGIAFRSSLIFFVSVCVEMLVRMRFEICDRVRESGTAEIMMPHSKRSFQTSWLKYRLAANNYVV